MDCDEIAKKYSVIELYTEINKKLGVEFVFELQQFRNGSVFAQSNSVCDNFGMFNTVFSSVYVRVSFSHTASGTLVAYASLRWEYQRGGENGESILFANYSTVTNKWLFE
jgi:hypothetical protein